MQRDDAADDRQAQVWLSELRYGTDSKKIVARRGLARIFEQRGMLEEAADLLAANAVAGAADAATYRWLARLYRALGEDAMGEAAAAEASRLVAARHPPRTSVAPMRSMVGPTWQRLLLVILALLSLAFGVALVWMLVYVLAA